MKSTIRTKLVGLCVVLILLTTVGISAAYYGLTRRDKHRESQQRIQIGFDIIFYEVANRVDTYTAKMAAFLQENVNLGWVASSYAQDPEQISSPSFLASYLKYLVDEINTFKAVISADRLAVYGTDKRLLVVYQRDDAQETSGMYTVSQTGSDTYLPVDDSEQLNQILFEDAPIPDAPLPSGVAPHYTKDIPNTISTTFFTEGRELGIRIIAPVQYNEEKVGTLVADMFYTQHMVTEYAALSKTAINFFAGSRLSVGTLPAQKQFAPETPDRIGDCEDMIAREQHIDVFPITFNEQGYYQGQCVFKNSQGAFVGAITVSLSQAIEKQEIKKILQAVLLISGITMAIAVGLSLVFSRNMINSIHQLVTVIGATAEGDLRPTATAMTRDEIGMLAKKLNQMIVQLRSISGQVQGASSAVDTTADAILRQIEPLIRHMEQQSTFIDNTTGSLGQIKLFIDTVAHKTNELFSAAAQILSSIQQTRASIAEVTTSTGSLTTNSYRISESVVQVNQVVKQIADHAEQLESVAQETEVEIHQIDQAFQEVSNNADHTQQLAKETMEAATSGQASVDASLQGMTELKKVVEKMAQIIQEVNSRGEQVNSILDIVDEITEQTSLLALNASIISAQAGVHGRGFAVVADEIKELATRTKTSTQEIGTLIRDLRKKTEEGVTHTAEGLTKADQGMSLARGVKIALTTILDSATRSSNRASDTAQIIQQRAVSSQAIGEQMKSVTEMVSHIRMAIQTQESDIEQVVTAVQNIGGMAEQVNRASVEQTRAAEEIDRSMGEVTEQFSEISQQTEILRQDSDQIISDMDALKSTTEDILADATLIAGEMVKNLVHQSHILQKIVNVFKVA
jgi:methyl-accepting chemotaxis protein